MRSGIESLDASVLSLGVHGHGIRRRCERRHLESTSPFVDEAQGGGTRGILIGRYSGLLSLARLIKRDSFGRSSCSFVRHSILSPRAHVFYKCVQDIIQFPASSPSLHPTDPMPSFCMPSLASSQVHDGVVKATAIA